MLTFSSFCLTSLFNSSVLSVPSPLPIILLLPFLISLPFPAYPYLHPSLSFVSPSSLPIHTPLNLTTSPKCTTCHSISALSLHLLFPFPKVWFSKFIFFKNIFLFNESRSLACLVEREPGWSIPPTGGELFFS